MIPGEIIKNYSRESHQWSYFSDFIIATSRKTSNTKKWDLVDGNGIDAPLKKTH